MKNRIKNKPFLQKLGLLGGGHKIFKGMHKKIRGTDERKTL